MLTSFAAATVDHRLLGSPEVSDRRVRPVIRAQWLAPSRVGDAQRRVFIMATISALAIPAMALKR
jgi:hypothetical protein